MKLKLAKDLALPLDAVTQTFLIVGKRGSGKSNTAARFVEQLYHARLPFVVLDPVDTWWGLKASRDGGKGLDVYVFGGRKADLPLEAGGGALIAELLCDHRMSMVLSVKHLSGRERSRFMVAFAQTLFQKWGGGPLHVVLEEAHELAPQMGGRGGNDTDGEAAMLGAFKRLWKLGRASGIGGTAVTQRPASLSKDITTQSEILIAHRTIGPQDVAAIGQWVKYHGEREDILADLPTLPTGEAFVWAPEFPEGKPIGLTRTTVLLRETYDSASTPKVGEQRVEPKELAAVDLERLRSKMAATIEKAKADDPKELRKLLAQASKDAAVNAKRISELEARVASTSGFVPKNEGKPVDVPVLTEADRALLLRIAEGQDALLSKLLRPVDVSVLRAAVAQAIKEFMDESALEQAQSRDHFLSLYDGKRLGTVREKLQAVSAPPAPAPIRHTPQKATAPATRPSPPSRPSLNDGTRPADGALTDGQQKILDTALNLETRGVRASLDSICAWMDIHENGGRFRGNLRTLREGGYLDDCDLTERGRTAARPRATGLDAAKQVLTDGQDTIVTTLEAQPAPISIEQLGALMGIHPNGGRFRGNVRRLKDIGLITSGPLALTEAAHR